MSDPNTFFDPYGLVVSKPNEDRAENGLLWTYELYLLNPKHSKKRKVLRSNIGKAISKMEIRPGLYHQHPGYTWENGPLKHRYMSRDQLFAICSASYMFGWSHHKEVWGEIKRQRYLKYDNHSPDNPKRWLHPRDTIYIGALNDNLICKMLLPILSLIWIETCTNAHRDTSGKLIAWCALETYPMKFTKWVCDKIIEHQYGSWLDPFLIYFQEEGQPNREAAIRRFHE